ncbi:aldehyde dehydrogenase family protein [Bacillus massiliigorillae]|uniref:aldehyde dehydrogenase family protein n=1 Tax=Bacillus massiliigorillae TaxID=1243664 RepID=UPI0003A580E6|nr:aldehyde dehydrogenase family protein [Bacillus massiliigorillae]
MTVQRDMEIIKRDLFIDGDWVSANDYQSLYSPYSEEEIGSIPLANEEETNRAIASAYKARTIMAKMPIYQRAAILEQLALLLEERLEEAARIIALEAAKPLKTAREEVRRTIQTYKFAAEEAKQLRGETIPLDAAPGGVNRIGYTVREPIGVIGAITPFNFPMNLVAHKVGPAIASGNSIVLKPASQTPLSSYYIAELFKEAGLPDGCLNVITGGGRTVGDQLVKDDRISKITFTGSPAVGIGIRNKAGLKRVTLELGSNAALIIDDGIEIDQIIDRCVTGAFSFQGQVCISLQRVYVHENLYETFVTNLAEATAKLTIGDPLDEATDVSALISKGDVERSLAWINEAKSQGAQVVLGGESQDNVLLPTILTNVDNQMKVSCQEVFAPIVIVNSFSNINEAIARVNDSRYGLQAGVYTNNIQTALFAADELHVGGVIINDIPTFRVDNMPYGGVKESGVGREGIKYAVEEMTELKLVVFNKN